MHNAVSCIPPF